jgi:hypothetical protein
MSLSGTPAGASCTQSAFKAGKGTFLFIGPGPKGLGFKAMFKRTALRAAAGAERRTDDSEEVHCES